MLRRIHPGPFSLYRVGRNAFLIDLYGQPFTEHVVLSKRQAFDRVDRLNRLFHEGA